jgi:hypothetical protein
MGSAMLRDCGRAAAREAGVGGWVGEEKSRSTMAGWAALTAQARAAALWALGSAPAVRRWERGIRVWDCGCGCGGGLAGGGGVVGGREGRARRVWTSLKRIALRRSGGGGWRRRRESLVGLAGVVVVEQRTSRPR